MECKHYHALEYLASYLNKIKYVKYLLNYYNYNYVSRMINILVRDPNMQILSLCNKFEILHWPRNNMTYLSIFNLEDILPFETFEYIIENNIFGDITIQPNITSVIETFTLKRYPIYYLEYYLKVSTNRLVQRTIAHFSIHYSNDRIYIDYINQLIK